MQQEGRFDYRHLFICFLVSFTAGLVVASFADFRLFLPALLHGAWITIQITAMSCVLAVIFALMAGLARISPFWPLRWIATAYIEVFRGTSVLVQLFWLFFVLPHFGITLDPFPVGVLALMNIGAYGAEAVRGAILAVPRGQYEASIALNMSAVHPHAPRHPAAGDRLPSSRPGATSHRALKATALVSLITVADLTFEAYQLNARDLPDGADLHARARDVLRDRFGHHVPDARARAPRRQDHRTGVMLFDWEFACGSCRSWRAPRW